MATDYAAWKQAKPHLWERPDGFSVAEHSNGRWTAAKPSGRLLRDGTDMNDVRTFADRDEAIRFVERYHRERFED